MRLAVRSLRYVVCRVVTHRLLCCVVSTDDHDIELTGCVPGAVLRIGVTNPTCLILPVLSIRQLDSSEVMDFSASQRAATRNPFSRAEALSIRRFES